MDKVKVDNLIANHGWLETDREFLTKQTGADENRILANAEAHATAHKQILDAAKAPETNNGTTTDNKGMTEEEMKKKKAKEGSAPTKNDEGETETIETYVSKAPAGIQEVLKSALAANEAKRKDLIATIKTNKANKFSDEVLGNMALDQLEGVAALAVTTNNEQGQKPRTFAGQAPVGNTQKPTGNSTVKMVPLVAPSLFDNKK